MTVFADCYGPPDIAQVRADGFGGLVRYTSHQAGKCITVTEAQQERAAGLELLLVFEDSATNALGGYPQGTTDARFANSVADSVGYPAGCPIFYAVDFPATPNQIPTVEDYFAGVLAVRARPSGVYGGITTVNTVMAAGLATYAWQTLAWSNGEISGRAVLYQSAVGQVFDTDEQLGFVPAWGATPQPAPRPRSHPAMPQLVRPIIAIVARPQNDGYWQVAQDGGVFAFGEAPGFPDNPVPGTLAPGHLIVDAFATPTGKGLTLTGSDGGVFNLGDSIFHGSIPEDHIAPSAQPISA